MSQKKRDSSYENMTPAQRSNRAKLAAYRRWYNPKRGSIERAETALRQVTAIIYQATDERNQDRLLRAYGTMLSWEKWLYYLKNNKDKALDMESVDPVQAETELKLLEARKRRNQALNNEEEDAATENK